MRVRGLVRSGKILESQTGWSNGDLPPRHAPIFPKTRPVRAGGAWKSARLTCREGRKYILTAICNPQKGKWQAILIIETEAGASVISRFEDHASHPGLHAHTDCDRSGLEIGPKGMDNLSRFPEIGSYHRRVHAWTPNTFWAAAMHFFKVDANDGPLFRHDAG